MPRFVLLWHELPEGFGRASHFDLMLEAGGVLRTWALAEKPRAGVTVEAEALADHRLEYLEYEGPVSRGRGRVTRIDAGAFQIERESDGELIVNLQGAQLRGPVVLTRIDASAQGWRVTF